jgi:ABC-type dipeptide/oligopeptide/nickel transport system permease component
VVVVALAVVVTTVADFVHQFLNPRLGGRRG